MSICWETIEVDGTAMQAYVARPEMSGAHPGVVVAQHGSGVDEFVQDVVHQLHRAGYAAIAPDLYHRQPPGLDSMTRIGLLRDVEILTDMRAATDHLVSLTGTGPLAVVGHCMGGRVAWLVASTDPRIVASVVLYGGNIRKPWGDGPAPFELAEGLTGPMLGLFGAEDTNPSPADTAQLSDELTRLGKWHEFHTYRDAGHAFCSFGNPQRFRQRASQAAWGEVTAFLRAELRGG
jgi:carboxymethylenebutenolidase